MFVSLAVTDSVNNVGGLAFVQGFRQGFSQAESTAMVRGDCFPPYVEVVTKFPVSGNSMVAFVNQWRGRASLSIGLIFPENRYLKTIYQITWPENTRKLSMFVSTFSSCSFNQKTGHAINKMVHFGPHFQICPGSPVIRLRIQIKQWWSTLLTILRKKKRQWLNPKQRQKNAYPDVTTKVVYT